jgi:anti-sigma factor RsiW
MMNCEHCKAALVEYCRNELPADTQAQVTGHLATCTGCSTELAALRQLGALLDTEEQPSPRLRANFLARLEEASRTGVPVQTATRGLATLFRELWPSRPLGAFSYSLALVVCGMVSGQLLPPGSLGLGTTAQFSNRIPAEQLIQLCAVPAPQANDFL